MRHWKPLSIAAVVLVLVFHAGFVKPPLDFPQGGHAVIEEGMTVSDAARLLEEKRIIRSSSFFAWLVGTFADSGGVRSGTYSFEKPATVYRVAERLTRGEFGAALVRVTFPEGTTVREMADILEMTLPGFDSESFETRAKEHEGYLFPDTYLFAPGISPDAVIATLRETFDEKVVAIEEEIARFGKPLDDVVIMASLLEKEARLYGTRRIVAGILWDRLDLGIALQTDAVFGYILGTTTFSPTFDQLEIDSPYNTYQHTGLPPGPIANPGIEALRAAVNPEKTPYLYYLTGADGTMHYAETFEEHVANRRFLR
ncbi:MAG: endolytic transglycosylase MltG [Candidatus Paceibacteria bacterium]